MIQANRYPRRASLRGCWKCVPLLALPFGILFSEAWLQTNILRNHYKIQELTVEQRALEAEIKELSDGRDRLSRMERIDAQAPRLNLVKPLPGQKIVINGSTAYARADSTLEGYGGSAITDGTPVRLAMLKPPTAQLDFIELDVALPPMDGLPGTD